MSSSPSPPGLPWPRRGVAIRPAPAYALTSNLLALRSVDVILRLISYAPQRAGGRDKNQPCAQAFAWRVDNEILSRCYL